MAEVVITPQATSVSYIKELLAAKNLWRALVIRELRLRYKQTLLGFLWVILQPVCGTIILTVVFGGLFGSQGENGQPPYALIVLAGLIFWNLFSDGVSFAANSFLNLGDLIKKVYFPRFLVPLASVCVAGVNFGVNFMLFFGMVLIGWREQINWGLIWLLPILMILSFILALFLGTLMATIAVKWRDIKHALGFMLQMLLFLSPVIYPERILPEAMAYMAYINPMTAIIGVAQSIFFSSPLPEIKYGWISAAMIVLISLVGWHYFRKKERSFADII